MKNLITIFNLLFLPFLFFRRFYSFQSFNVYTSVKNDLEENLYLSSLFKSILVPFFLVFSLSINTYATNFCSGATEIQLSSSNTSGTLTGSTQGTSGNDYIYFNFTEPGTLNVSVVSASDRVRFSDDGGSCPSNNEGKLTEDYTRTSSPSDFNIRIYRHNDSGNRSYTFNWTFTPSSSSNTPNISIAPTTASITEGTGTVGLNVTLSEAADTGSIDVDYTDNCNGTTGTVNIAQGSTSASLGINTSALTGGTSCSVVLNSATGNNSQDVGSISPDTSTITVTAAPVDQDPIADAGPDQSIIVGNTVALDGSGSTDDGTINSYSWSVDGSTYSGVSPTISGLAVGTYTATLTVTDNASNTDTDTMEITVNAAPSGFGCANPRSYTQAFYANKTADIDIIGNSVVCQNNNGVCSDPGNTRNNSIDMIYIDVDGDDGTFNHSSAELNLPTDSKVIWAGLYWQGMFAGPTAAEQSASQTIKLKIPGGSYVPLTSDSSKFNWVYLKETANRWMYQGVVEITSLINTDNANGYYSVADLSTQQGTPAGGSFGAWSIVLVYENSDLPVKNVTVYDGYQGIMPGGNGATCADRSGDPKKACEYAQDNGCSIDLAATGVANPVSVTLSGFLTPDNGTVNSTLALFSGEGDRGLSGDRLSITNKSGVASFISDGQNPVDDVQNATISKKGVQVTTLEPQATLAGGTPWINTLGADIDLFDITGELDNEQSSTVVTMNTSGDGYFPGVFAFSTELFSPSLCYDYSYKQNEQYFTEDNNGSFEPRIIGDGLSLSDDVTVELFIQNTELSDVVIEDMTVSIVNIDTTQAAYVQGSTYTIFPNTVFPVQNTDTNFGDSHNSDIPIGTVDSKDFFYIDYDLDVRRSNIDMPLDIRLNYNLVLPGLNIPLETYLGNDMPLCSQDNFSYAPLYANFNVENSILSQTQKYNLPTQTANRAGDFVVTSYDVNSTHTRLPTSTVVAIELIDAGKYHGIEASCYEPDSALTPRVWVIFDNNVSVTPFDYDTITTAITNGTVSDQISGGRTPITTAGEFYGRATENAAFRIGFNRAGDGDEIIQLEPNSCRGNDVPPCVTVLNFPDLSAVDLGNGAGRCIQDIDGNPNNADTIPQNCGNAGNAGMDSVELAICMECLYGYNIDFLCSRDNFAIRPESFRMSLKDQDQTDNTQQSDIASNNDTTQTHAASNALQIVADYDYALDINATNHESDSNTPGYYASFLEDGNASQRSIRLNWETSADDSKCNDTEDHNQSATFFNGTASTNVNSPQVGEYTLTMIDKLWTHVDNDPAYMGHHTSGDGVGYFISGVDCVENSSAVPVQNASTSTYAEDMSGCDITTFNTSLTPNHHTNINLNSDYTDIALRVHPYRISVGGLSPQIGPYTRTNGQTFVYIDTPPTDDDHNTNMSYNLNGTFFAGGYNGVQLTNFVTGCYADDLNMDLNFTYNHTQPPITPFLSYSLKDHNTTDSTDIYRPAQPGDDFETGTHNSITTPLTIAQANTNFVKVMLGAITMDLGFNFDRTFNQTLNPRNITFNDFNITYNTPPTTVHADLTNNHQIFGDLVPNQTVAFLYGRTKSGQFFYDDVTTASINTPISIVAFCDLGYTECQDRGIMAAMGAATNEDEWWLSVDHTTGDGDGNVTLAIGSITEGAGSPAVTPASPTSISTITNATDNTVNVSSGANPTLPMTVEIDLTTSNTPPLLTNRWLIYNPYSATVAPSPFYKVRFIGDSLWTGVGQTGNVVGTGASTKKSQRMDW